MDRPCQDKVSSGHPPALPWSCQPGRWGWGRPGGRGGTSLMSCPVRPQAPNPDLSLAHVQAPPEAESVSGHGTQVRWESRRGPGAPGSGGAGSGRQTLQGTEALSPYRCRGPIKLDLKKKTYIQRYNDSNFRDCKQRSLNPGSRVPSESHVLLCVGPGCLHWSHPQETLATLGKHFPFHF